MISGLNHITLAVSSLSRSIDFYCDMLGCKLEHEWDQGAYLAAGDLWLCLAVCDAVDRHDDYTHVAFTATRSSFAILSRRFTAAKVRYWQENSSEGESLYVLDPDGHKLEVHIGSLRSRLAHVRSSKPSSVGCNSS